MRPELNKNLIYLLITCLLMATTVRQVRASDPAPRKSICAAAFSSAGAFTRRNKYWLAPLVAFLLWILGSYGNEYILQPLGKRMQLGKLSEQFFGLFDGTSLEVSKDGSVIAKNKKTGERVNVLPPGFVKKGSPQEKAINDRFPTTKQPKGKIEEPKKKTETPKTKTEEPKHKVEVPKNKSEEPKKKNEEPKDKVEEPKVPQPKVPNPPTPDPKYASIIEAAEKVINRYNFNKAENVQNVAKLKASLSKRIASIQSDRPTWSLTQVRSRLILEITRELNIWRKRDR